MFETLPNMTGDTGIFGVAGRSDCQVNITDIARRLLRRASVGKKVQWKTMEYNRTRKSNTRTMTAATWYRLDELHVDWGQLAVRIARAEVCGLASWLGAS
jgi:hypothetical protein